MAKILLVEDNDMNRDMLARRLQRRGHQVVVAPDGETAVSKAEQLRPDVILMDLSLPVMDGWEATRRIKGDEATADIPIIALTAHALAADRDKALSVGCDDFATKPVEFGTLQAQISALLGES